MKLLEKKIDFSDPDSLNFLIKELKTLSDKGFREVSVLIEGSLNKSLSSEGIDEQVFTKILKLQNLPEWVVYDLFRTQGAISENEFDKKINNFE